MYRKPTRDEKTLINRALGRWGVFEYFKDREMMISEEGRSRRVCVMPQALGPVIAQMQPYLAGLAIGELKKQFMPSMAGADLFARVAGKNEYYVVVNENAEQLVLYGRDVMGESVVEASSSVDENEVVIILNKNREAIGIGRTRFAGVMLLQKGKVTMTTITDAGHYLREEG